MRDKSGQPVPYMEVGGTTYFPASPMPPHPAMVPSMFSPTAATAPHSDEHPDRPEDSGPAQHAAAAAQAGSSSGGESVSGGSASKQRGRGRPPSGHTPLRMAGSALRLLEDNPYLVQDTIGSNKSPDNPPYQSSGYHSSGGSMSSGGSGGRQYTKGGARSSPRRGYAASPRQQQQQHGWQVRRNAGSSNSVGSAGIAAAGSDVDAMGRDAEGAAVAGSSRGPRFDVAAINAALALPGSSNGNSAAAAAVHGSSKGAGGDRKPEHAIGGQKHRDDRYNSYNDSSSRNSDQVAAAGGAASADPAGAAAAVSVKPSLSVIPETAIAADSSPPRVGISSSRYGSDGRPLSYSQLGAQDPIVSPGRITLASKVKAARFSAAAAHAAAGGTHSPGSE